MNRFNDYFRSLGKGIAPVLWQTETETGKTVDAPEPAETKRGPMGSLATEFEVKVARPKMQGDTEMHPALNAKFTCNQQGSYTVVLLHGEEEVDSFTLDAMTKENANAIMAYGLQQAISDAKIAFSPVDALKGWEHSNFSAMQSAITKAWTQDKRTGGGKAQANNWTRLAELAIVEQILGEQAAQCKVSEIPGLLAKVAKAKGKSAEGMADICQSLCGTPEGYRRSAD